MAETKFLRILLLSIWLIITTPISIRIFMLCTTLDFAVWVFLVITIGYWFIKGWFIATLFIITYTGIKRAFEAIKRAFNWLKNKLRRANG